MKEGVFVCLRYETRRDETRGDERDERREETYRTAHILPTYPTAAAVTLAVTAATTATASAELTGFADKLDFQVGDHHHRFNFDDASFDGAYSFQALWPFFKPQELEGVSKEIFRVLKPGGVFACSEYLLTPAFDWKNPEHVAVSREESREETEVALLVQTLTAVLLRQLHRVFMPTLAATQSNYPATVVKAMEAAGFEVFVSLPSVAPAWPLTDQKTDLFILINKIVWSLRHIGICPAWVTTLVDNLLLGGSAWMEAEKAKLADLNWKIVARKP